MSPPQLSPLLKRDMNKIQEIKEKCIEANKSILDLKFGCEVEVKNKRYLCTGGTFKDAFDVEFIQVVRGDKMIHFSREYFEIIGRPIRLDDCALIVKDKHYLIDNWLKGNLEDQDEKLLDWILA